MIASTFTRRERARHICRCVEFDIWHEATVATMPKLEPRLLFQVGWAAKILNVYLKTLIYVGGLGRDSLRECLHPPLDQGLWDGIRTQFSSHPEIIKQTHSLTKISHIQTYAQYSGIIAGMRLVAEQADCVLIEVEQFWKR